MTENDMVFAPNEKLRKAARELLTYLTPEAIAQTNPEREKTEYKHSRPAKKRKGGSPPLDFSIVDMKLDLELALKSNNDQNIALAYYPLKRLVYPTVKVVHR